MATRLAIIISHILHLIKITMRLIVIINIPLIMDSKIRIINTITFSGLIGTSQAYFKDFK